MLWRRSRSREGYEFVTFWHSTSTDQSPLFVQPAAPLVPGSAHTSSTTFSCICLLLPAALPLTYCFQLLRTLVVHYGQVLLLAWLSPSPLHQVFRKHLPTRHSTGNFAQIKPPAGSPTQTQTHAWSVHEVVSPKRHQFHLLVRALP